MLHQTDVFLIDSFSAAIASTISLFGLLLASIGIYSTVSYVVVLRTREVGIRMAIGAQRRHILAVMMRESSRPVLAGLLVRHRYFWRSHWWRLGRHAVERREWIPWRR